MNAYFDTVLNEVLVDAEVIPSFGNGSREFLINAQGGSLTIVAEGGDGGDGADGKDGKDGDDGDDGEIYQLRVSG